MLREARRRAPSYRQYAFQELGKFVALFDEVDMYDDVHGVVAPLIQDEAKDADEMDVDPAPGKESSNTM